jgi:hypothetical protein
MSKKLITRRNFLKDAIAVGTSLTFAGFLPDQWIKPVVKSVFLPEHAQASMPSPLSACPVDLTLIPSYTDNNLGLVNNIRIRVIPVPATGTPVSYSLLNILPASKLSGALTASATTDASGYANFPGTITYLGTPSYSFTIRIETLGCYREIPIVYGP